MFPAQLHMLPELFCTLNWFALCANTISAVKCRGTRTEFHTYWVENTPFEHFTVLHPGFHVR